jgi:SAM-dependent methyltransferase
VGVDSTKRFSNRVSDYVKYRPGYPEAFLDMLETECGFARGAVVADVGSGTGKLTASLLSRGAVVHAVEPNREMRLAAEELLGGKPGFVSVDGTAEATTLRTASVDLVTAGQAFHWFRPKEAAAEFRRILRPGRFVVLVWNDRDAACTPFFLQYDEFLREYSIDYEAVNHHGRIDREVLEGFFTGPYREAEFPNTLHHDYSSLLGGYLSASYALTRDHPRFPEAMQKLRDIFDKNAAGGRVEYPLMTRAYFAPLDGQGMS